MAEVTREIVHDNRSGGSGFVSWLALILAIAALTLAWLAYNRAGADLEDRIRQQVEQSTPAVQEEAQDLQQEVDEETTDETTTTPDQETQEEQTTEETMQ